MLWKILEQTVFIGKTRQTVLNAIKIFTRSVFNAINDKDLSLIQFYQDFMFHSEALVIRKITDS